MCWDIPEEVERERMIVIVIFFKFKRVGGSATVDRVIEGEV